MCTYVHRQFFASGNNWDACHEVVCDERTQYDGSLGRRLSINWITIKMQWKQNDWHLRDASHQVELVKDLKGS